MIRVDAKMVSSSLVILICLATEILAENGCPGTLLSRHINERLQCGIFKTLAANAMDCQKQCTTTLNCFSANTYQSDNGTEICEMVRGSKDSFENESCLVEKTGGEHNELMIQDSSSCSVSDEKCDESTKRKALRDEWYQMGSSAYKHFKTKKTWKDANDACSANKTSLATIDSELENRFVTEVFLKTFRKGPNLKESMGALKHWKLDGSDKDVILYGDATYEDDQFNVTSFLRLRGSSGSYATTPTVAIQTTSFTVSLWVYLTSVPSIAECFYSYWLDPFMFGIGANPLSDKLAIDFFVGLGVFWTTGGNISVKQWNHIVGTWDRATKKATVYLNGNQVVQQTSSKVNLDLPNHVRSVFDVGYKRDADRPMEDGSMRELAVFDRSLTSQEVKLITETTSLSALKRSMGAWIGPTHLYTNWAATLQANSSCVFARGWKPYQQDKVPCDEEADFICEKPLN